MVIQKAPKQAIPSNKTSLNQIPAIIKRMPHEAGTVNFDVGGGAYDKATEFLKAVGVTNLVYDLYNRSEEHNSAVFEQLDSKKADTATVANLLNVIAEPDSREYAIATTARYLKPDGVAYFSFHEGNRTGVGKPTVKGWQENRRAETYLEEISKYFDNMTRKGNTIIATSPKQLALESEKESVKMGFVMQNSKTNDISIFKNMESLQSSISGEDISYAFQGFLADGQRNGKYPLDDLQKQESDDEIIARAKEDFFDYGKFVLNWNSHSHQWAVEETGEPMTKQMVYNTNMDSPFEGALNYFEENLSIIHDELNYTSFSIVEEDGELELQADGEEYGSAWALRFEDKTTFDDYLLIDSSGDINSIKLSTLFDNGLLSLVENVEEYRGDEEVTWQEFVTEAKKIITESIEKAQGEYIRRTAANKLEAICHWGEENGYDHIIIRETPQGESFYFAKYGDKLPTSEIGDKHVSFERWTNMVLEGEIKQEPGREGESLHIPIPERYEKVYAREIAGVEDVKFIEVGEDRYPIKLESDIKHGFVKNEKGEVDFTDNKNDLSTAKARTEIGSKVFVMTVTTNGIDRKGCVMPTEDDHKSYKEIDNLLAKAAKAHLAETIHDSVLAKAEEYGRTQNWNKEQIDTLVKDTQNAVNKQSEKRAIIYEARNILSQNSSLVSFVTSAQKDTIYDGKIVAMTENYAVQEIGSNDRKGILHSLDNNPALKNAMEAGKEQDMRLIVSYDKEGHASIGDRETIEKMEMEEENENEW